MSDFFKRAVITGPTGSIGMALIEALIKESIEVIAVVRPGSIRSNRIKESGMVKKVVCDLSNLERLSDLIPEGADLFYHLGWDGTFGDSRNNMYSQNDNIRYALDAVKAASAIGCHTFVGAGSQAEYGRVEGRLNGKTSVNPENGYGIAKLCAGKMTRVMCQELGIRHIWTRILSIYGPYDNENTMIMSTINSLLKGQKPACTKGDQMWDYLYSKDAGRALVALGKAGLDGKVYCLARGDARPLREYIKIIKDGIDSSLEIGFGEVPYGPKQVMHLCADISDLKKDTGFVPLYTFEDGIKETIEWCRNKNKA